MHTNRVYLLSMTTRIHIPIDEADKARFRRYAQQEGKSLSAWLRDAAEDRIRKLQERPSLRTRQALSTFFTECDRREVQPEPDWEEHRRIIERSRTEGLDLS